MIGLEAGTLIECDVFGAVVVCDDLMLVYTSEIPEWAPEGSTIELVPRGPHAWTIKRGYEMNFLIERDWKGNITADWAPDEWDDWESSWDFEWSFAEPNASLIEAFDDYRSLSSPAHIPRAYRAFSDRHKSGGHRRR